MNKEIRGSPASQLPICIQNQRQDNIRQAGLIVVGDRANIQESSSLWAVTESRKWFVPMLQNGFPTYTSSKTHRKQTKHLSLKTKQKQSLRADSCVPVNISLSSIFVLGRDNAQGISPPWDHSGFLHKDVSYLKTSNSRFPFKIQK